MDDDTQADTMEGLNNLEIDTIDNPSWQCLIDLADTPRDGESFTEVKGGL